MSKSVQVTRILPVHADARGSITDLVNTKLQHVGLITTEKGAVRANHYHLASEQYSYILSGEFEVVTAPLETPGATTVHMLRAGDLMFIPARHIHRFTAVETAIMIDMISESRSGAGYESDVMRVGFSDGKFHLD